jgi:hypothetical protein
VTEDEKQKLRAEVEKAARDSAIASYTQKKLLEEHPDLSKEQKAALNNASNEYYKISQDKINSVKKTDKPFYDELRMLNAAEQGSVLMELQAGGNKFGNELSAITNKLSGVIGNTNKTVADTNQYRPELFPAKPAPQDVKSDSQPPAIKLADENPKSTLKEDDFTTQLKRALLRSAIASRVLDEVTEKHPEILNVEPDKRLLLQTLGINEHAQVFNQIDSKLSDGKLITQAELLERMAGTPEQRKKYSEESKKISPKEDFSRGSPEYLKEIYAQIDSGMHDAEITALRGEVNKKIGAKYVGKLIDAARKELQEVAIGNVESDKLTKILGRLEKNHDLGPEVLDPAYDYKNNTDTGKRDKTAEKMQKRVNYSIESGDALMKAHAALNGIRSGEVDAKEGIMIINDQLSKYGFGYDRLDKAFDPFNPHMPHRTVDEMKWEIKSAVTRGNNERVEHIKAGKNYNKPDYNLDLKEMLSVKEDKAKAEEVFSKVSGKVKERKPKVVPELPINVVIEKNYSEKPPQQQSLKEPVSGIGTKTPVEATRPLNALEQTLGALQQLRSPEEQLKTAMLEDRIKEVAVKQLLQEEPNLSQEKRQALNKFAMYDGKIGEISGKFPNHDAFVKAHEIAKGEIYNDIKSGRYNTVIRNKMKEAYAFIDIAPPLRYVQIKDADFHLPYDIKQTALKEAEALLGNPNAKTDPAVNAVLAEAAKITKDGDKSPDVVASYLIAKTITQPTLCHDHNDYSKQVILVEVGEPSKETIKRPNKDDKFVFAAAMQIFGDNFPQNIKGGIDTMGPQGDRPYIEAANKTEIGGRCR